MSHAHLVIGGARSGKSGFAQRAAVASALPVRLIVTAEILDAEMAERIARHRAERPAHWQVIEAPRTLAQAIRDACDGSHFVLVDCLTLWLSNILCCEPDKLDAYADELVDAVQNAAGQIMLVSNEVGWSIVPENALARAFRDEQGRLNQRLAQVCRRVTLVAAGLPLDLKSQS